MDRLRRSRAGHEIDNEEDMPVDFPYLLLLHAVMGGRAAVTPVHLLDSASPEVGELQSPATSGPTIEHRQRHPILLPESERKMQLVFSWIAYAFFSFVAS